MLILGIDSSTEVAAVGLYEDGKILGEMNISLYRRHSERLMPNIDHLFNELGLDIKNIDGIAVTVGPGSFTGLRIGISTVKGFAQVLDVPVVGVSTLDLIAYNLNYVEGWVVPLLDARRKRVYTSLYKMQGNNNNIFQSKEWEDQALPIDELIYNLSDHCDHNGKPGAYYLIGNGVNIYRDELVDQELNLILTPPSYHKPRGGAVAELGQILLQKGKSCNVDHLVPNYLKKPQAEINYKKIGSE